MAEHHDQHEAHHEMSEMDHGHMHHEMSEMYHGHMHHDMSSMDHGQMNHDMGGMAHMHHGNFKQKFWLSLVLAVPIFVLAPFMGLNLPFQFTFPGADWVVLVLATALFGYGGQPFLAGAKSELKQKQPGMMTLIAMGISVAYLYSLYAFINNHFLDPSHPVMDFFWELASLIVIMLLGHWIEMNAVMSAGNALDKMAALLPSAAHVLQADGSMVDHPLAHVQPGQSVVVQAGEKVPVDGVVTAGTSAVNEALVTGESKAVTKTVDDTVIGGSVNGDGTLTVKVTGTGETGYLAQVAKLVSQAQQEKSQAETMADKVSKWLFYAAVTVGLIAFVVWAGLRGFDTGLNRLVTVLVIACPHALGLAIPLVVARSTALGATHGLLVRDRKALEQVKHIDTVMMDKTGTLTEGQFKVQAIVPAAGVGEQQLLTWFAQLEQQSSHPLATGIMAEAKRQQLAVAPAESVSAVQGVGLVGQIDGHPYQIVTAKFLDEQQLTYDQARFSELAQQGYSVSYLVTDKRVLGLIAQGDTIKPSAKALIAALRQAKIEPVMLTGDNAEAASVIAKQLGITQVHAELKPEDKAKQVQAAQQAGHKVMMIGDGINDAPSLARADIGVAIGAGTDVAIDSADIVLVKSEPSDVLALLHLGKATTRKMVQNLWWGAGYNVLAIPLAAGILAGIGIVLSPAVGAVLMSASTVIVAVNAMTLKVD